MKIEVSSAQRAHNIQPVDMCVLEPKEPVLPLFLFPNGEFPFCVH